MERIFFSGKGLHRSLPDGLTFHAVDALLEFSETVPLRRSVRPLSMLPVPVKTARADHPGGLDWVQALQMACQGVSCVIIHCCLLV